MESPTKELAVNGSRYQLSRFSARDGSWIVGQFLAHNLLAQIMDGAAPEIGEKELGLGLAATFRSFPEETYNRIQAKALTAVRRLEDVGGQSVPKPLLMTDGREVYSLNPVETLTVTVASLVFNLHCFFEPEARKMLLTVFPDLSSLPVPGSTATS